MPLGYRDRSGPARSEEIDEGGVALLCGDAERSIALAVESDEVRAFVDQKLAYGDGALYGGEHEERPALVVGEVGVEALIESDAESWFVAAFD